MKAVTAGLRRDTSSPRASFGQVPPIHARPDRGAILPRSVGARCVVAVQACGSTRGAPLARHSVQASNAGRRRQPMGARMNYDLEAARLKKDWAENPRWKGIKRGYTRRGRRAAARLACRSSTRSRGAAPRSCGSLMQHRALRQHARRADRQPGDAAGEGRPEGDLPVAAGRSRPTPTSPARCIPTSRCTRSTRVPHGRASASTTRFMRADQIQRMRRQAATSIDYFAPIVADAEAGFGGVLNAFELMKAMIEAGAAGVHFEDQLASVKKCGHMGGKVLVPTREAVAEAGRRAPRRRRDGRADDPARAHRRRSRRPRDHATSTTTTSRSSPASAPSKASTARARASTRRSRAASPTRRTPTWSGARPASRTSTFAQRFAEAIHAKFPGKLLAYNCSPSFNWKKNLDDATIAKFQRELGAMGYKFQFITLAGFHSLNYSMFDLAHGYARNSMSAFVELQQAEFAAAEQGLHRGQAPARGRHRLLRRGDDDHPGRQSSTTALRDSTEDEQFFESRDERHVCERVDRKWVVERRGREPRRLFPCRMRVGIAARASVRTLPNAARRCRYAAARRFCPPVLRVRPRRGAAPVLPSSRCARPKPRGGRATPAANVHAHGCLSRATCQRGASDELHAIAADARRRCLGGALRRRARSRRRDFVTRQGRVDRSVGGTGSTRRAACGAVAPAGASRASTLDARPFRPHVTLARHCRQTFAATNVARDALARRQPHAVRITGRGGAGRVNATAPAGHRTFADRAPH